MSVQVADDQVFDYLCSALIFVNHINNVDSPLYNAYVINHMRGLTCELESENLVTQWRRLNEKSWAYRYREEEQLSGFYSMKKGYNINIDPVQLLKYLHYLLYQIETKTIVDGGGEITKEEFDAYGFLLKWKNSLAEQMIQVTPEWKAAKWG